MTLVKYRKWIHNVESCTKCNISSLCKNKVIPVLTIPRTDILFIGEAPGQVEYVQKEPFVGPSGICLRAIIEEAVPQSLQYIITNAILCTPFEDSSRYNIRQPSLSEIRECGHWLRLLIKKTQPRGYRAGNHGWIDAPRCQ